MQIIYCKTYFIDLTKELASGTVLFHLRPPLFPQNGLHNCGKTVPTLSAYGSSNIPVNFWQGTYAIAGSKCWRCEYISAFLLLLPGIIQSQFLLSFSGIAQPQLFFCPSGIVWLQSLPLFSGIAQPQPLPCISRFTGCGFVMPQVWLYGLPQERPIW